MTCAGLPRRADGRIRAPWWRSLGITDTPLLRVHVDQYPNGDEMLASRLRRVPLGAALTPDAIAKAILYFSCEDSAGITGTSRVIDGGYLAAAEWDSQGGATTTNA